MSTVGARKPFQGVRQIVTFNGRMYVAALSIIVVVCIAARFLDHAERDALPAALALALFWMASSLLVSHYVYDRSGFYELGWLTRNLRGPVASWINIHSGWDESSTRLAEIFPDAAGKVVDIFDPRIMTEPSIHQARRLHQDAPLATSARHDALPFCESSFDAAFCIFAAHELRRHDQRVALFSEIARVLRAHGDLLVVEHLRDWRNFLAFGPGFLHFFSQAAWRRAASAAGLTLRAAFTFTPFVRVFIFGKSL